MKPVAQPQPKVVAKPADLLSKMIQVGQDGKSPQMQKLLDGIAMVEKRAGISVRDHLGFGNDSNAVIKYWKDAYGDDCIGEMNSDNKKLC